MDDPHLNELDILMCDTKELQECLYRVKPNALSEARRIASARRDIHVRVDDGRGTVYLTGPDHICRVVFVWGPRVDVPPV